MDRDPRLTLTAGLRFDVPFLPDTPAQNLELLASALLSTPRRRPAATSSGHPGSGSTTTSEDGAGRFSGAASGLFAGRPIYLYFSNTFESTLRLVCEGEGDVPAFTPIRRCNPGAASRLRRWWTS